LLPLRVFPVGREPLRRGHQLICNQQVVGSTRLPALNRSRPEVYIPRIQRGNALFAAKILGARGALLSILAHFFEHGRWGSPAQTSVKAQSLTAEDQLCLLMQAGVISNAHARIGSTGGANLALNWAASLATYERDPAEADRFAFGTD